MKTIANHLIAACRGIYAETADDVARNLADNFDEDILELTSDFLSCASAEVGKKPEELLAELGVTNSGVNATDIDSVLWNETVDKFNEAEELRND